VIRRRNSHFSIQANPSSPRPTEKMTISPVWLHGENDRMPLLSRAAFPALVLALGHAAGCGGTAEDGLDPETASSSAALGTPSSATLAGFAAGSYSVAYQPGAGTLRVVATQASTQELQGASQASMSSHTWTAFADSSASTLAGSGRTPWAAVRTDGLLEIVWVSPTGQFCHGTQGATGGFLSVACNGSSIVGISQVVAQQNGQLNVVVTRKPTSITGTMRWWRQQPLSAAYDAWTEVADLGNSGITPYANLTSDVYHRLHVFYDASPSPVLTMHKVQDVVNGATWSSEQLLAPSGVYPFQDVSFGTHVAVGMNQSGGFDLVALNSSGCLYEMQSFDSFNLNDWGALRPLGCGFESPAWGRNANGKLELFAVYSGGWNLVYSRLQDVPGGSLGAWRYLMDTSNAPLAVGTNQSGALELFTRNPSTNEIQHRWQASPGVW
jgi:hypothetical protein